MTEASPAEQVQPLQPRFRQALVNKFGQYVKSKFTGGEETADAIVRLLDRLRLPLPGHDDYFNGNEGILLFSSAHGIVIRLMQKEKNFTGYHPLVLQPIRTFDAVNAVVGIYPGIQAVDDDFLPEVMRVTLNRTGLRVLDLWRRRDDQLGCLPVPLPVSPWGFPSQVPLVIDTGAVWALRKDVMGMRTVLAELGIRKDPQHALYAPLRRSLKEAWPRGAPAPDPARMAAFWRKCAAFREEGKLVAGWDDKALEPHRQRKRAAAAAQNYDRRLAAAPPGAAP